ncbi:MAG TPA: hypothetical protein VF570_16105, partial [Pyrinomonadaceae bacterium]
NGQCVSYINMTTGRSAILGLDRCPAGYAAAPDAGDARHDAAGVESAAAPEPAKPAARPAAARAPAAQATSAPRPQAPGAAAGKKEAARPPEAATRPRRAEPGREH